jgi:hypothetical protein
MLIAVEGWVVGARFLGTGWLQKAEGFALPITIAGFNLIAEAIAAFGPSVTAAGLFATTILRYSRYLLAVSLFDS